MVRQMVTHLRSAKPTTVQITNYRKDGATFTNVLSLMPVSDSNGEYRFSIGVLADLSNAAQEVPLLERLKFLCISSTNLDEFFEVRVAGLKQKAELSNPPTDADSRSPREVLRAVSERTHTLVDKQYQTLNKALIPALEAEDIRFLRRAEWKPEQRAWLDRYFEEELLPVISPIGLDPAHPFPRILNKSLNFIVDLDGTDAFGRKIAHAVVQAPRALPRVIQLPPAETDSGPYDFVFLSSVIHEHVGDLFPSMNARGCYQFRVTRNSDLYVDEEEVEDLLRAVEGELPGRRYGDCVRLEGAHNCPEKLSDYLLGRFLLSKDDLYQVNGPVNVNRLMSVLDAVDRPDLKSPAFSPRLPQLMSPSGDTFAAIRHEDVLLHHPFDSFLPVIEFVRRAGEDPHVLAIKQTLYRTGPESAVVDALVEKALNATTREDMTVAAKALDRVLRAGHYWIPQWYKAVHTVAVWDRFGRPASPPTYDFVPETHWWSDPARAAAAGLE